LINTDVRYQARGLRQVMPNLHIKDLEHDNRFTVAGGIPGDEIAWQITAERREPYMETL
jgi:hypothetical protein